MAIDKNMIHCLFLSIAKTATASHQEDTFFQNIIRGYAFVKNFPCVNRKSRWNKLCSNESAPGLGSVSFREFVTNIPTSDIPVRR